MEVAQAGHQNGPKRRFRYLVRFLPRDLLFHVPAIGVVAASLCHTGSCRHYRVHFPRLGRLDASDKYARHERQRWVHKIFAAVDARLAFQRGAQACFGSPR